jgi:hypothetical protein
MQIWPESARLRVWACAVGCGCQRNSRLASSYVAPGNNLQPAALYGACPVSKCAYPAIDKSTYGAAGAMWCMEGRKRVDRGSRYQVVMQSAETDCQALANRGKSV